MTANNSSAITLTISFPIAHPAKWAIILQIYTFFRFILWFRWYCCRCCCRCGLVGKITKAEALALSTNPHPLTYLQFNCDSGRAHFSLFRVVEARKKKVFFGAGKIRERCWLKALEAELPCTKRREAFYIMSNYRCRGACQKRSLRSGGQRFAGDARIILLCNLLGH